MFDEQVLNNEVDEFIRQLQESGTYATVDELKAALGDFSTIMQRYKDYGLSKIVEILLSEVTDEIISLTKQGYALPGILVGLKTPLFNINISEGYTKDDGEPITKNSLFDLASITKLYTGVIAYKLIDEGILSMGQIVSDLFKEDGKFQNLGDLSIRDIMQFKVKLLTVDKEGNPARIDTAKSTQEAQEILYNTKVVSKDKYDYNDIGMMILKEIMEKVTGKSFSDLFNEYIVQPLSLQNTFLTVPDDKKHLITGTPNITDKLPNDPKAIIMGGYSGHAGVFANNEDILQIVTNLLINPKYFNPKHAKDLITPGVNDVRGIFGSTYVSHPTGLDKSFVDQKYPHETFAVQGSTRTQAIGGILALKRQSIAFGATILMNPGALSLETVKIRQDELNQERVSQNKAPINLITERKFIGNNGNEKTLLSVDARPLVPATKLDELNKKSAIAILKLTLLGNIIKGYGIDHTKNNEFNFKASK
jgi:CubicO group peptidase (beta-lactamase class C family)